MRAQLFAALRVLALLTIVTGLLYPLVVTGLGQLLFNDRANGSLIERDGEVVGSSLIGQTFTGDEYFHPRPSAPGGDGGPSAAAVSGASNLGPTNPDFLAMVEERVEAYRETNGLADDEPVPVDAVTASGSGLDPHISIANARLQAERVADERGMSLDEVLEVVDEHTSGRSLGFLGERGVNVLELNLALDEAGG
jgi:K+-transporting ATPase ATPase C chain